MTSKEAKDGGSAKGTGGPCLNTAFVLEPRCLVHVGRDFKAGLRLDRLIVGSSQQDKESLDDDVAEPDGEEEGT